MATIYNVAKLAGVSPKTVSRVLNGDGPVGEKTREAVERAIQELGYLPSSAARMMRSNRSGLIGLVTGAISGMPDASGLSGLPDLQIVQGIQRIISESGLTLMIADTGGDPRRVPDLLRTFLEHRAEGLIYVADRHRRVNLPQVAGKAPTVLVNCFDDAGTPAVIPDDRRGQRDLVDRLIAAGHRRIAYLTLRSNIVATPLRIEGYRAALAAAAIPFDQTLVESCDLGGGDDELQLMWSTIDRMLTLPDPPTVFCCGNDTMAMRVYGILRSRGLKVPTEISVAGYDNYRSIAETLYPPLTTVDLPYFAMGVRAAQLLIGLIGGEGDPTREPVIISGPVHWRGSVMALPTRNVVHLKMIREE